MKRKKSSIKISSSSQQRHEVNDDYQISTTTTTIPFIPTCLISEILSRLSVKSILRCRCVCKLWLHHLSSPDFTELHFSRAPTCSLLWNRRPTGTRFSGCLYLVEFERDIMARTSVSFHDSCYGYSSDNAVMSGDYYTEMKLTSTFGLPKLLGSDAKITKVMDVVNSCNGLLCLYNDPLVVYNPVLRECVSLPKPEIITDKDYVLGLGFNPKTNHYKVLRATAHLGSTNVPNTNHEVAEVHTLGTTLWRRIGSVPNSISSDDKCYFPTFLNGALHWLVGEGLFSPSPIVSFNFDGEEFGEIEPPVRYEDMAFEDSAFMGMGVLTGCLYISKRSYFNLTIWVMKDYGIKESWTKDFNIDMDNGTRWPRGFYKPIDILKNGDLLLYHCNNAIITYNGSRFKYFKVRESKSKFVAIAYTPSFVSLKDLVGDNVMVLNVRPRGRRNKKDEAIAARPRVNSFEISELPTKAIFLVKEHAEMVTDFHGDSDEARHYEDDC